MDAPELDLTLVPAPEDPPLKTPAYQTGLRQFEQALKSHGLQVSYTLEVQEAWTPEPIPAAYLGDFTIKLALAVVAAVSGCVGTWLHGRNGRKVRLKVGEIEAEAQTIEDVDKLLAHALEI